MSTNLKLFIKVEEYECKEAYMYVTKKILRYCNYNRIVYFLHTHNDHVFDVTLNNTYSEFHDNEIKKIILD
jgi:hypothetical protein